jgi:hypothetical protein
MQIAVTEFRSTDAAIPGALEFLFKTLTALSMVGAAFLVLFWAGAAVTPATEAALQMFLQ